MQTRFARILLVVVAVGAGTASNVVSVMARERTPVIVATDGRTCQISEAALAGGGVYLATADVARCAGGEAYLNARDGMVDIRLPGQRLNLWTWGTPVAIRDASRIVDLSDTPRPWFWRDGRLLMAVPVWEKLAGTVLALRVDPVGMDIAATPRIPARFDTPPAALTEAALLVVVDPGHGGEDSGAHGPAGQIEKDITLRVGLRLAALLRERGYRVELTRDDDTYPTLSERVQLANRSNADLFLSLHCNSAPRKSARGIETYVLSRKASDPRALALAKFENTFEHDRIGSGNLEALLEDLARQAQENASIRLATPFHNTLIRAIGAENRGVRRAPFFVLAGTTMPAFLVELGFLSNAEEATLLADPEWQTRLARSVAASVDAIRPWLQRRSGAGTASAAPPTFLQ
ncbi:MAG: N-acetylmuramoyl-L-alanine amidase [Candidatus Dadabacteria bacterium]|nr:MAG: N-acetylmuramoyl-L-alanine amidase [Candidatus Dadabacteria bacterium]